MDPTLGLFLILLGLGLTGAGWLLTAVVGQLVGAVSPAAGQAPDGERPAEDGDVPEDREARLIRLAGELEVRGADLVEGYRWARIAMFFQGLGLVVAVAGALVVAR